MVEDRRRVVQRRPRTDIDLTAFPSQISTSRIIFRAVTRGREAWWYSSSGAGRFDLTPPRGTSYWADDAATAARERLGDRILDSGAVTTPAAMAFDVARARLPRNRRFAEVSSRDAARFGVTRELVTMIDYGVPQAWARAFDHADFNGIRYASRFTTGAPTAWAIFGTAGLDRQRTETTPVAGIDACRAAGIEVLPLPGPKRMYTVIEPPHDR